MRDECCTTSNHAISGRQPTSPVTGTGPSGHWSRESGCMVRASARASGHTICTASTAALWWRSVREADAGSGARGDAEGTSLETHRTLILSAGVQACWWRGQAASERLVLHTAICSFAEQHATVATSSDGAPNSRTRTATTDSCPSNFSKSSSAVGAYWRRVQVAPRHFCAAVKLLPFTVSCTYPRHAFCHGSP